MVIRLFGLGSARLEAAGQQVDRVLAQPKRLALLVCLASAPGAFHRRDALLGLLWPESDGPRARAALRNGLYFLHRHLGDDVLITRGDGEVGLDSESFWFDAAMFEAEVQNGRFEPALELYRGDLLAGFFLPGAPEFERWLEDRRARLRRLAAWAAAGTAEALAAAGDFPAAIERARRACVLSPFDEPAVRRLIVTLDAAGNRAGALESYARFREELIREFAVEPSPETDALVLHLRRRLASHDDVEANRATLTVPAVSRVGSVPSDDASGGIERGEPSARSAGRRRLLLPAAVVVALATATGALALRRVSGGADRTSTVVVMPIRNETGDSGLDLLSEALAYSTTERLARLPGLFLLSGGGVPDSLADDPLTAALSLGGAGVLTWSLRADSAHPVVHVELFRTVGGARVWHCECPIPIPDFEGVTDTIVAAVSEGFAGHAGTSSSGLEPGPRRGSSSRESRLLYLEARHFWTKRTAGDYWKALALLQRAIDEDPGSAEAYAWLSATFGAMAMRGFLAPHETWRRAEAAAQRAMELDDGLADAHSALGAVRGFYYWDWDAAERDVRRAIELDPGFAEAHNVLAHMYRATGRLEEALGEARTAARLDPLEPYYDHHIGTLLYCSGREREAIRHLDRSMRWDRALPIARRTLVAAWSRTGRADSALAVWHEADLAAGDTAEARIVIAWRDRGLEATVRAVGRAELATAEAAALGGEFVPPMRIARANARAGNRDAAMEGLLLAVSERDPQAIFLRCDPAFEALQDDPRLEEAARRIGLP